jgi:hypothetical protein
VKQPSLKRPEDPILRRTHVFPGLAYLALLALAAFLIAGGRVSGDSVQNAAAGAGSGLQSGAAAAAKSPAAVTITGLVRQPLRLGLRDLRAFGAVTVRRVDHRSNGFFGDFECRGVPLSVLISLAGPRKESSSFLRPTDLAIVVHNDSGQRALFSYGELLFRPPGDVVLAFEAEPMMPKRSCDSCHANRSGHNWREALKRKPVLPRLVSSRDLDADRSLEGVTSIEVVELFSPETPPKSKGESQPARSQAIEIRDGSALLATARSLAPYVRRSVHALEVGDAMGYHGEVRCEGALLTDVLSAAKAPSGPDIGYVLAAVDGYRALLSSAELFSAAQAPPILVADRCNGQPLADEGIFKVIVANDTIAERWVKSVASINIVRAASSIPH